MQMQIKAAKTKINPMAGGDGGCRTCQYRWFRCAECVCRGFVGRKYERIHNATLVPPDNWEAQSQTVDALDLATISISVVRPSWSDDAVFDWNGAQDVESVGENGGKKDKEEAEGKIEQGNKTLDESKRSSVMTLTNTEDARWSCAGKKFSKRTPMSVMKTELN